MHMDYGNNMWSMPLEGPAEAVAAIVYYSDTKDTGGGTAIVPRQSKVDPTGSVHWQKSGEVQLVCSKIVLKIDNFNTIGEISTRIIR